MAKGNGNLTVVNFDAVTKEVELETVNGEQEEVEGAGLKGDKKTVAVPVSSKFEEAINKYATANDLSLAQVGRKALAQLVGYDLSQEPIASRGARRKYANKEEAEAAQKAKVTERNELIKKLLAEYREKEEAKNNS